MDPRKLFVLKTVDEGNFALLPIAYERELNEVIAERLVLVGGVTKWLLSDAGWAERVRLTSASKSTAKLDADPTPQAWPCFSPRGEVHGQAH